MQEPVETEWDAALRRHGILAPKEKPEITEDDIVNMIEQSAQEKINALGGKTYDQMNLEELKEHEDDIDDEDERFFEEYRKQRLAEVFQLKTKNRFGSVMEISKPEWVKEVNEAGEGVFVFLHVYSRGTVLCNLINFLMSQLCQKFLHVKFVKAEACLTIPNYPDTNVPTIFIYQNGDMKHQFIGPLEINALFKPKSKNQITANDIELKLAELGIVDTDIDPDYVPAKDDSSSRIRQKAFENDSDDE